jgi:hypothetical protein
MRTLLSVAVLLVFQWNASGGEQPKVYYGHGRIDGKSFSSKAPPDVLAKTPVWPPETEQPPLSPRRAQHLASEQLQNLVRNTKEWQLLVIALKDTGDHLHWYYLLAFIRMPPPGVAAIGGDFLDIVVLMDGTVIKPELDFESS